MADDDPTTPPAPTCPTQPYGQPPASGGGDVQPMPPPPSWHAGPPSGPPGQVRVTGMVILLSVGTLGIYALVYYFSSHEESRPSSGEGIGGGLARVSAVFLGVLSP